MKKSPDTAILSRAAVEDAWCFACLCCPWQASATNEWLSSKKPPKMASPHVFSDDAVHTHKCFSSERAAHNVPPPHRDSLTRARPLTLSKRSRGVFACRRVNEARDLLSATRSRRPLNDHCLNYLVRTDPLVVVLWVALSLSGQQLPPFAFLRCRTPESTSFNDPTSLQPVLGTRTGPRILGTPRMRQSCRG